MNKFDYVYGIHTVNAVLNTQPQIIVSLYLQAKRQDQRLQKLLKKAQNADIIIIKSSRRELDVLVGNQQHQGVVAQCKSFIGFDERALSGLLQDLSEPALLLILDGVQDPHNLGACLRSANAFGVQAVITPKNRAVGMTPVVRKVACGAEAITPFVQVTNLSRTMQWLQQRGIWIIGTEPESESTIRDIDLSGDVAIVLGSEGEGMRRLTKHHCDFFARIPMYGTVASVNVSVACAISLYEAQRQRIAAD